MHTNILTYMTVKVFFVYLCSSFEYCVKHFNNVKLIIAGRLMRKPPRATCDGIIITYICAFAAGLFFKGFSLPFGGTFLVFSLRMALNRFCHCKKTAENYGKLLTIVFWSGIIEVPKERKGNNMDERKIQFNDEFVSGHIQELLGLKIDRRIITDAQSARVTEILELKGNTVEQLTAKRNSVVKLLTDDRDDDAAWATMSGVVHVIDGFVMTLLRV